MKPHILVTSAESKISLGIVRSLAKEGYRVSAAGVPRMSQSFYSRYCSSTHQYTHPKEDSEQFISDLKKITENNDFDVLLPIWDAITVPLALHKHEFDNVKIPVDEYANIEIATDKEKTFEHARSCDVPIPRTYCPDTRDELQKISKNLDFPVVVKLRKAAGSEGLQYIHSRERLLDIYEFTGSQGLSVDYSRPLIQEYIPGDVHDVCVLFDEGELQKALTQKRLWTFPADGGGGIVNVTTDRPELIELADELLSSLDWHGVAQVEFIIDERTGEAKLVEINPKIWGTTELSISAGMNFPLYLTKMSLGEDITGGKFEYTRDLYFIWYSGQLIGSIYQSGEIIEYLRELYMIQKESCHSNIQMSDPIPHLVRLLQIGDMGLKYIFTKKEA